MKNEEEEFADQVLDAEDIRSESVSMPQLVLRQLDRTNREFANIDPIKGVNSCSKVYYCLGALEAMVSANLDAEYYSELDKLNKKSANNLAECKFKGTDNAVFNEFLLNKYTLLIKALSKTNLLPAEQKTFDH